MCKVSGDIKISNVHSNVVHMFTVSVQSKGGKKQVDNSKL